MKDGESNDRRIPAKIHCIIDRKDDEDNNTQRSRNSREKVVSERSCKTKRVVWEESQNHKIRMASTNPAQQKGIFAITQPYQHTCGMLETNQMNRAENSEWNSKPGGRGAERRCNRQPRSGSNSVSAAKRVNMIDSTTVNKEKTLQKDLGAKNSNEHE